MKEDLTIVIADRNSHVRMFLMREIMTLGCRVKLAATAENVLQIVNGPGSIALLILDPHFPGLEASILLRSIREINPALPIMLHTHRHKEDEAYLLDEKAWFTIVEKDGDSVERVKEAIGKLLEPSESCVSIASNARRRKEKAS